MCSISQLIKVTTYNYCLLYEGKIIHLAGKFSFSAQKKRKSPVDHKTKMLTSVQDQRQKRAVG